MKKNIIAATLTCLAGTSFAGEPVDTVKVHLLQDVQVVAQRATKTTPVAFKNLTRKDIQAVNFGQDLPFLLSLTPSVTMTSDAGNGIGYTTLRVRGTDPSRINITMNGIPVNDAESSQVYWVNMGDFASSLSSLQIQRGVGTSVNGAAAFGATLNMKTEDIGVRPFLGLDMSVGSYGSNKQTLRFGTGLLEDQWGIQGRISHIGSDGYVDRASTRLYSYFLQAGYFGENTMLKFITSNGWERTYHAWKYTSEYDRELYGRTYNPEGIMKTDAKENPTAFYPDQNDNYHQQHYNLLFNQLLGTRWSLNAALHYTRGFGYYEQYKMGKGLFSYDLDPMQTWAETDLVRQKFMNNHFYGAIASLTYDDQKRVKFILGGGWNQYDGDHYGHVKWAEKLVTNDKLPHTYYDNDSRKRDGNVYGKLNITLWKGLDAYADLQYRHVSFTMNGPGEEFNWDTYKRIGYNVDKQYNFLNPKAGLTYNLNDRHRLYASYAISHREPVRNNFQNALDRGFEMPVAERLNDWEAGYQYNSPTFAAGLNLYYMNYKNQFVLTGEIDPLGEGITRNLLHSYRMGVEAEMKWHPTAWFTWNVNATWSKNRVKNMYIELSDKSKTRVDLPGEQPLSYSPSLVANNVFTFTFGKFAANVMTHYVSDQYMNNTGFAEMHSKDAAGNATIESLQIKAHCVTNVDLSYRFAWRAVGLKDATVGLSCYNVFSTKYDTNGWVAPSYVMTADKQIQAVNTEVRDRYVVGRAPAAPFNFMAHLSLNF